MAKYGRIVGTEIVVALEGKNRVELYRRHSRNIVAQVTSSKLPDPFTMRIHHVDGAKHLIVVSTTASLAWMPWFLMIENQMCSLCPFRKQSFQFFAHMVKEGTSFPARHRGQVEAARCEAIGKITNELMFNQGSAHSRGAPDKSGVTQTASSAPASPRLPSLSVRTTARASV